MSGADEMNFEIESDLGSWKGTEVELGVHFLLKIHVDNCVADCMVRWWWGMRAIVS